MVSFDKTYVFDIIGGENKRKIRQEKLDKEKEDDTKSLS